MKKLRLNLAIFLMAIASTSFAQHYLESPSNLKYSHMGEGVATYNGLSALGAYEDGGTDADRTYAGAVYLYSGDGALIRSYQFTDQKFRGMEVGRSVAMNGSFIAASAPKYNSGSTKGAVFVARNINGQWENTMKLAVDNDQIAPSLYYPIALDHDGTLAIGSPNQIVYGRKSGAVFIYKFNYSTSKWEYQTMFIGSKSVEDGQFGYSLALDNGKLIVGAPTNDGGKVYIFHKENNNWVEKLRYPDGQPIGTADYGHSVDISDGTAIVSGPKYYLDNGMVQMFELVNGSWTGSPWYVGIKANSVAIENAKAVAGTGTLYEPSYGKLHLFLNEGNNDWSLKKTIETGSAPDAFGWDVDIQSSKILVSLKYADKGSIYNTGAGRTFDFWATAYNYRTASENFTTVNLEAKESLYPNPCAGSTVTFNTERTITKVEAINQLGKITELTVTGNTFDVSKLASGLYTLNIYTNEGREVKPLSVK